MRERASLAEPSLLYFVCSTIKFEEEEEEEV
jgi:hypothetical protein